MGFQYQYDDSINMREIKVDNLSMWEEIDDSEYVWKFKLAILMQRY